MGSSADLAAEQTPGSPPGKPASGTMRDRLSEVAGRLTQLGFSQYEARTYIGFLVSTGATGYSVANDTGVPQPKVYETLRRLIDRGAIVQTAKRPARYAAVPPSTVLGSLENGFRERLEAARRGLERLPAPMAGRPLPMVSLDSYEAAAERAHAALERARTRVYLHGRSEELRPLAPAVAAASAHWVEFVIVHFGPLPFPKPPGQAVRHESTEGTIYPSRSARHLAVVVDSAWALWALARDGVAWEGMCAASLLFAGLVKTYIRHDLFVQRMYADAPEFFEERYGPGLLRLAGVLTASDAPAQPDEASTSDSAR